MFGSIKARIEDHFSLVLILACGIAMVWPVFKVVPDIAPPIILAILMGFSYSKMTLDELKVMKLKEISLFYICRFLILPLALYYFCALFLPDFRYAVLLMALCPIAASAGVLTGLYQGNSTLAVSGTVISSILAPFIIPAVFHELGMEVNLDTWGMLQTLVGMVFAPALVYFGLIRHHKPSRTWVQDNSKIITVLLFSSFILIVIAKLRDEILADLGFILSSGFVMACFFVLFYAVGWFGFYQKPMRDRIGFTMMSGCMNIGIGVSLALLYFPMQEKIYIIICEFLWVFSLAVLQYFFKKHTGENV